MKTPDDQLLGRWLLYRARLLGSAVLRGHWMATHEEWLMLQSSARGLIHGFRVHGTGRKQNYDPQHET